MTTTVASAVRGPRPSLDLERAGTDVGDPTARAVAADRAGTLREELALISATLRTGTVCVSTPDPRSPIE